MKHILQLSKSRRSTTHEPAVAAFEKAITEDPVMKFLFDQIFLQVSEENQVEDFEQLLFMLDSIIVTAPKFEKATDSGGNEIGQPVGVPIYIILDLFSNTSAGYDLFRMKAFNNAIKALLDNWGRFLMEPGSNVTLNQSDEGWFGRFAIPILQHDLGQYTFEQTYKCPDPTAETRGFQTWDAFFVREFNDGMRPIVTDRVILEPGQPPRIAEQSTLIYSPCESTVFRIEKNVKKHDQFWLKAQSYSLYDMLNRDDNYAQLFEGGTVYQAFLSPVDFHRWHSPIKGTIEDIVTVEGTYYAVLPDEGAEEGDPQFKEGDPHGAIIRSQPFITIEATRVLIYIKSENSNIGTVCFVAVGMVEVSTCQVMVKKGQDVEPGTELGMFHFGGSSSVLIFPKEAGFEVDPDVVDVGKHIWINTIIGVAGST